jgi:hypothetical protein
MKVNGLSSHELLHLLGVVLLNFLDRNKESLDYFNNNAVAKRGVHPLLPRKSPF